VRSVLLGASLIWPGAISAQTASPPLIFGAKIPLGEVSDRMITSASMKKRQRLLIAELGNNCPGVADLTAGKVLRRVHWFE
jgi:hypothetical protein